MNRAWRTDLLLCILGPKPSLLVGCLELQHAPGMGLDDEEDFEAAASAGALQPEPAKGLCWI